jgi:hypothetical protein
MAHTLDVHIPHEAAFLIHANLGTVTRGAMSSRCPIFVPCFHKRILMASGDQTRRPERSRKLEGIPMCAVNWDVRR